MSRLLKTLMVMEDRRETFSHKDGVNVEFFSSRDPRSDNVKIQCTLSVDVGPNTPVFRGGYQHQRAQELISNFVFGEFKSMLRDIEYFISRGQLEDARFVLRELNEQMFGIEKADVPVSPTIPIRTTAPVNDFEMACENFQRNFIRQSIALEPRIFGRPVMDVVSDDFPDNDLVNQICNITPSSITTTASTRSANTNGSPSVRDFYRDFFEHND